MNSINNLNRNLNSNLTVNTTMEKMKRTLQELLKENEIHKRELFNKDREIQRLNEHLSAAKSHIARLSK